MNCDKSLAEKVIEIGEKLALIEEKLQSPDRTVEDIITHMQLIKELRCL